MSHDPRERSLENEQHRRKGQHRPKRDSLLQMEVGSLADALEIWSVQHRPSSCNFHLAIQCVAAFEAQSPAMDLFAGWLPGMAGHD